MARLAHARAIADLGQPDSDSLALAERLCDSVYAAQPAGSQLHVQSFRTSIDIAFTGAAADIDRERRFRTIIDWR